MPAIRHSSPAAMRDFVSRHTLAIVGVSRNPRKFANAAYRDLRGKGYALFPVNPHAREVEGDRCFASLRELPQPVDGVIIMVPPAETEKVVLDAAAAGITRVWMQQGAESPAALAACDKLGVTAVAGECILMFAEPVRSFHAFHRWCRRLVGRMPR